MIRTSLVLAVLGAALSLSSCENSGCADGASLRDVLGGGLEVCLGQRWSPIESSGDNSINNASSLPGRSVEENGFLYSYEPGGGIDLVAWRPFGILTRACGTPSRPETGPISAEGVMQRLGGEWLRMSPGPEVQRWRRDDGTVVSIRTKAPLTLCIKRKA
jgi:hypothetical protein